MLGRSRDILRSSQPPFHLQGAQTNFETSFFGLVSLLYSLFAGRGLRGRVQFHIHFPLATNSLSKLPGNTFLFLYERQMNIVEELYSEACFFAPIVCTHQNFFPTGFRPRAAGPAVLRRV